MSSIHQIPEIVVEGSVRADLLGGTIDLYPINYILENVITLNVALGLKAKVKIEKSDKTFHEIISLDYNTNVSLEFKEQSAEHNNGRVKKDNPDFKFVIEIFEKFIYKYPVKVTLSSGAPTGSGLGGSSSMGVTLYKALSQSQGQEVNRSQTIKTVQNLEARQLNKGVPGCQDYFPALYGGVLGLAPSDCEIEVEQLYEKDLCHYLESHAILFYSNHSRFSGINNWEVYKSFFDGDSKVKTGLESIASLSKQGYDAIKSKNYAKLVELMIEEGIVRSHLFENIVTKEIQAFVTDIKEFSLGFKTCGAGGGGCFLVFHSGDKDKLRSIMEIAEKFKMKNLGFSISSPL